MRAIRVLSLCLACAFGASALSTTTASAEAPEYGRCKKIPTKKGAGYSDAGCTKAVSEKASYEWAPGPGPKAKFTLSMTTASATIETVKGSKMICTKESGPGEYVGTKELRLSYIKLNGCSASGLKCNSAGAGVEEIVTNELSGNLRVEKFSATEPKLNKLANELVPTSAPLYVEFECAGFKEEWRKEATGGVLNTLSSNKMLKALTDKYTATKGEEKPSEYEPTKGTKVEAGFESNFAGGPFEELAWTITMAHTNEEAIEANSVV